jgi:hypothetical protein
VFTKEAGLVGVDLDDCFHNGRPKSWARDVYAVLDSYTEYSPSMAGLHIFVSAHLDGAVVNKCGFEMYGQARYFTVTGKPYLNCAPIQPRQKEIDALRVVFQQECVARTNHPNRLLPATGEVFLARALRYIPPKLDYDQWLRVLMGVHSVMPGQDGVRLIEGWSPGHPGEVAKKFTSFKRTGVGLGSVLALARQHGMPHTHVNSPHDLRQLLNDKRPTN